MSENSDAPLEGQDMKSNQELASVKSNGSNNFKFDETPWGTTRKRYEKSYSIEREDRKVDDKNGGKEEQLVLCRLKKQKVYKGKVACIDQGANRTFELSFQDIRVGCVKNFRCKLNPNGSEPNIDDVMKSLRSIAK